MKIFAIEFVSAFSTLIICSHYFALRQQSSNVLCVRVCVLFFLFLFFFCFSKEKVIPIFFYLFSSSVFCRRLVMLMVLLFVVGTFPFISLLFTVSLICFGFSLRSEKSDSHWEKRKAHASNDNEIDIPYDLFVFFHLLTFSLTIIHITPHKRNLYC